MKARSLSSKFNGASKQVGVVLAPTCMVFDYATRSVRCWAVAAATTTTMNNNDYYYYYYYYDGYYYYYVLLLLLLATTTSYYYNNNYYYYTYDRAIQVRRRTIYCRSTTCTHAR